MKTYLDYINITPLTENQKSIVDYIYNELVVYSGVECKIKFKLPFFYKNTWVAYLNPIKKDGIEFCIVRAKEIPSIGEFVNYKNRTMIAGISYYSIKEIDFNILHFVFQEAYQLDSTTPYTFKKTKILTKKTN
jgi:hypothetical protein